MGRQNFQDGPFIDPPVASGSALVSTSAEALWSASQYTPIFANDPKAGKIYSIRAGGIISTGASGTLILAPTYGSGVIALGPSVTQTVPVSVTNLPWYLQFDLVFRVLNGSSSTCIGTGCFVAGGAAGTAGSAFALSIGGTSASVDATSNQFVNVNKTLSVAGSVTTMFAYIFSRN
jgi:hypothetical protein